MNDQSRVTVNGSCAPRFERVRDAFETNFRERNEIGAAVAVWVDGELAVNLWGGSADAAGRRPWQDDTLASIFSGSKALTSTCIHLLADRGELDLQAPVAEYWPEFAQAGKQDITVAMVMGHRSGVIGPRTRLTPERDPRLGRRLRPPRKRRTLVAARHRAGLSHGAASASSSAKSSAASPAAHSASTSAPKSPSPSASTSTSACRQPSITAAPTWSTSPTSATCSPTAARPATPPAITEHPMAAFSIAMGFIPDDELGSDDITAWRTAEFPSTNAHVTALGLATFYNALAHGKILSYEHMEKCRISQGGFDTDLVLGQRVADHGWGLGYMLNQRGVNGPNKRIFGHGGSGGSLRLRRPRTPHRLRLRHEQLRRHQVQRRPAQRRPLQRGLLRSGRNPRLVRGPESALSCEYAGRHGRRLAGAHHCRCRLRSAWLSGARRAIQPTGPRPPWPTPRPTPAESSTASAAR